LRSTAHKNTLWEKLASLYQANPLSISIMQHDRDKA